MAVACGFRHSAFVSEDGLEIFACGRQLGTGDNENDLVPVAVSDFPAPVRQVATAYDFTGIVTEAGDLLMYGVGKYGGLGLGDWEDRATPTLVPREMFDGQAVLMVSCKMTHTAAVTEGGDVYTFGEGGYGCLGHGDRQCQKVPRRVSETGFNGERIVMVAAGQWFTVALSEVGHVFTWGRGVFGQLGHSNREDVWAPKRVQPSCFGGERVVFVAAGKDHTVAVTAGGLLYTWGYNNHGKLGHNDIYPFQLLPRVVDSYRFYLDGEVRQGAFGGSAVVMAACGDDHTLVVTHDGALWACGRGSDGRLGNIYEYDHNLFAQVGVDNFGNSRVVAAAAGCRHSAAVTEDGALWTWGCGGDGELGHGDIGNHYSPCLIESDMLNHKAIGRCRQLHPSNVVAFAMGMDQRLNANSPFKMISGEPGLFQRIARHSNTWIRGLAGQEEGVVRLVGGVDVSRQHRYGHHVT